MPTHRYDVAIIGTGQAGPTLASQFAAHGYKTAIIEKGHIGGTCVNDGCTPTKTMVASARIAYLARESARWGIHTGDVTIDMNKVIDRKNELVLGSRNGLTGWLESLDNLDIVRGHARFISPNAVAVGDDIIEADRFYINTGGRPRIPDFRGLEDANVFTNRELLELRDVPEHLIVIGGSYIGLEFGQMFRRFGSKVTIVEMQDRLISREDPDVSAEALRILEAEGINVRLRATCIEFEPAVNGAVSVNVDCELDGSPTVVGTHVLLAVGRVPNTDDLGLDKAGVEIDERGYIVTDDFLQTTVPHIWALGDVNGKGAFTHTAYNDNEIVAHNTFNTDAPPRRVSDRFMTYGLFIDPPLGRVGMTETQARSLGKPLLIGKKPMAHISRAKERGETFGLMKFIIDAETEQFLGATVFGIGGDEIVHTITDAMYAGAPYTVIRDAVHIHPTVSELIPTTLQQLELVEPEAING